MADSLEMEAKDGIMYGPLKREEHQWKDFKVSPMTVRLKPNGQARIIMDLSYPHKIMLGRGDVSSPNEGMANFLEFETITMVSDCRWRCKMYRAGSPCEMVNADWDMVYKHVSVRCADHHLQVVVVSDSSLRNALPLGEETALHCITCWPPC